MTDPRDELLRDAARLFAAVEDVDEMEQVPHWHGQTVDWLSAYAALQAAPRVPCRWSGVEEERFRDHGCPAGHCGYCAVDQAAPRADAGDVEVTDVFDAVLAVVQKADNDSATYEWIASEIRALRAKANLIDATARRGTP